MSSMLTTFNSLYEIRGVIVGAEYSEEPFFQFSLWDSYWWTIGLTIVWETLLSILFMRFFKGGGGFLSGVSLPFNSLYEILKLFHLLIG